MVCAGTMLCGCHIAMFLKEALCLMCSMGILYWIGCSERDISLMGYNARTHNDNLVDDFLEDGDINRID